MTVTGPAVHLIVCLLRARNLANKDHDEHFGQQASDAYAGILVESIGRVVTAGSERSFFL